MKQFIPKLAAESRLYRLQPGDSVGFKAGDGLAHAFINNTEETVRLLCIGDTDREDNRIHYAVHPERKLGDHDGLPDKLRENNGPF